MKFIETPLKGAFAIELAISKDERGFFARTYCAELFRLQGLVNQFVQANVSFNLKRGTLRGMHIQAAPFEEVKLVRCSRGAIYDVIVDLRPHSNTFKKWFGIELNEINQKMLYIPEGFAHGFLTLEDNSEVYYHMSNFYSQESSKGVRWDDPAFKIDWPFLPTIISAKDRQYLDLL